MFRTGDNADFGRMLDDILARAKVAAASTAAQVTAESSARGTLMSSGTPVLMEQGITPTPNLHRATIALQRVRMEGWRQERLGSRAGIHREEEMNKSILTGGKREAAEKVTHTGLLMEGLSTD
jgi:hypothetical protein